MAEYKKVLVCPNTTNYDYLELYQLINSKEQEGVKDLNWYYKDVNGQFVKYDKSDELNTQIEIGKDCSAINYYVETSEFNHWMIRNSINIDMKLKRDAIITDINNNLNLSISNYSANSKVDYNIFKLSDADWDQALSNISMITFLQGMKVGLKTYNNYSIVTSTQNNEYVSEDSLYYIGGSGDKYYHRNYCSQLINTTQEAYKNTDFKIKSYNPTFLPL